MTEEGGTRFTVNVKCGAAGEAVVAKDTSMSSLRRARIYGRRDSATDWLVMKDCIAHPVSRTGVGNANSIRSAYNEYRHCLRLCIITTSLQGFTKLCRC